MFTQNWSFEDDQAYSAMIDGFNDAIAFKSPKSNSYYYLEGFKTAKQGLATGLNCWMVDGITEDEYDANAEWNPDNCEF